MQLDVNVDGCGHGKEVVVLDGAIHFVGPDLHQVDDLKCKFTGLGMECVGDCEIKKKLNASLPGCGWWLKQSVLFVYHALEVERRCKKHAVVLTEPFEFQCVVEKADSTLCCSSSEEDYLNVMVPSVLEGFCWHLLIVAARCDVCCVLCLVWRTFSCPNQRTIGDALSS